MFFLACMLGSLVIVLGLGGLAILAIVGLNTIVEKYGSTKRKE